MKTVLFHFFALIFVLFSLNLDAQCIKNANGDFVLLDDSGPCPNAVFSAVPFLRIIPDARSGGLGDAGISLSVDPNAVHYNDSKLVHAENKVGLSATYTPWLPGLNLNDVYLAYLSGYYKFNELQAVGFAVKYFSYGTIPFTDINAQPLGDGRPHEFALKGSYARKLSEKFSAGLGLKYIFSNLASGQDLNGQEITNGQAFAADISFTYLTPVKLGELDSDLTLGLVFSNLGSKITYTNAAANERDFIPANLGFGAGLEMELNDFNTLTFIAEINKLMVPTPCLYDRSDPNDNTCDDGSNGGTANDGIADYKQQSSISGIFSSFGDAQGGFSEELREITYSFGLEYWYDKQFAVRAGYFGESDSKGGRSYLTVGVGLKYNIFGLNFSYLVPTTSQRNPLDNTLRFSLLFDFGNESIDAPN